MKSLILLAFLWFNGSSPVSLSVSRNADPVVGVAVEMMSDDLELVTDTRPVKGTAKNASLRIIQYDREKANLRALGVPAEIADSLMFVKEAFYVGLNGKQLVVVGSDARGTAYGALEVSRLAGVSPWVWWGDSTPEKLDRIEIPEGYSSFQHPSVEYRGLFLNDEDWGFRPWSALHHSPQDDGLTISCDTYREIFKLLLRLRANTIWPAMHPDTTPFFEVPGAREAADSFAIRIGTSHCEPLLRNNNGEWSVAERGRYNYVTNREAVLSYWEERLVEVGKESDDLFTIGMRGIHDGSMEGVRTMEEKTSALQQVIYDQRELLRKHVNKDVTKIPQMFMPYKEVLQIMENGLEVPEDVTIIWCDDNYGYMTRLSDEQQQKRSGGAGVYYHLSYCGRPHDHLWLSTVQPGLIYNEMRQAYDHNARKAWIVNVHDPKVAAYGLEFFLDMAWNVDFVRPQTVNSHLAAWLEREYGQQAGSRLLAPMLEFYRLTSIRKPEFMGWSQVELDKKLYTRGLSPVKDTEFSFSEFGNEAQRHIDDWRAIRRQVEDIAGSVPEYRKDSYFANVLYPVHAAGAMAEKQLYAQLARQLTMGRTTYSPGVWETDTTIMCASALSQQAFGEIRELTRRYDEITDGKWKGIMSYSPRDLYVFWAPRIPVMLNDGEAEFWADMASGWKAADVQAGGRDYLAADADEFSRASTGVHPVQNLGHSCNAVPVPAGESLEYEFEVGTSGKATLRVAVIPTQANDKGDIRFGVSVDGGQTLVYSIKEPFRSERWKENVMRQQRVVEIPLELSQGGHTLRLCAIDNHIVFDQWMVDFKPGRRFYVFPTR